MAATDTSKRLGFGLIGALLAGGLLLAACAAPDGRASPSGASGGSSARGR